MKFSRLALLAFAAPCVALLPAQDTRLSNVSVRTSAGGADILITGFTIGPGPDKTVLIRAVGPTLGVFGVPGTLADPKLELYYGSTKIAENDNFNASDAPAFAAVGAFPLDAEAKDAALVATLAPGSYTAQVSGNGGASGVALVEVYEVTGGTTRLINLSTRAHVGIGTGILIPGITVAPGAGTRRLLFRAVGPTLGVFGVRDTLADPKLELYSGTAKIAENDNWGTPTGPATADAATLNAAFGANGAFALTPGSKDAALLINLIAGSYTLQVSGVGANTGAALVEVYDLTPANQTGARPAASLYLAQLRPDSAAAGSTASGYATLLINPDGTATVNVTFTNLTSAQTSAHLQIGTSRDYVLDLPRGQVNGVTWVFAPSGAYTTNELINALNTGNISVGVESVKFPGGELRGNFTTATGSQTFTAPAAPPALPSDALSSPTALEATRFLLQSTFGPTTDDITAVMSQGLAKWIDAQMALSPSLLHAAAREDVALFPNPPPLATQNSFEKFNTWNRNAAWWKIAITAQDQLRQRVAFALSQLFVISGANANVGDKQESMQEYYDTLVRHAFGNYRQLLESVTVSPIMGVYLSHLKNQKADPVKGTSPDENYARELQQLFTIGLVQLQPDGTLLLDAAGKPIPTYNQATISETAKVLTGWTFSIQGNTNFFAGPQDMRTTGYVDSSGWLNPMVCFDAFHDKTQKKIVSLQQVPLDQANPTIVPANQTGPQDLKVLLDALFNHPNTGPFVSKQLIQRLVTSNPSPGYVYRVSQVFANDGAGIRGNLGAVVRALLTDFEARSLAVAGNAGFGKVKEPLLRVTAFMRALKGRAPNGRFLDSWAGDPRTIYGPVGAFAYPHAGFNQGPMMAPSVFNFFSTDFAPPGPLAAAGLVAPEMQIIDSSYALIGPNSFVNYLLRELPNVANPPSPSPFFTFDFSGFLANSKNADALLDQLSLIFCGNSMSVSTRSRIAAALQALAANTSDLERVQSAIQLTVLSPDAAVQR